MKILKSNNAITAIIGTVLLLAISVALISVVFIIIFSYPFSEISPSVSIVGTIDGNKIILEHHGGEALSLDTEIIFRIGNINQSIKISDNDYLSPEEKDNQEWGIGEKIVFQDIDPTGKNVEIIVIDPRSNSIILRSELQ